VDQEELKILPEFDEKDVVVLKGKNFSSFIKKNRYVMVQFYVPRCSPCDAIAPEYAAAATTLKGEAVLAKVNATQEKNLARKYEIKFMPMVYFFVDGVHKPYSGHQTKDGLVSWVKKRTGPGAFNITTLEAAEHISNIENKFVLGLLDSLVSPESNQLCSASRHEDDINFYQTDNPDVAKFFHIDPTAKRPALVLVKKEDEKFSHFDGKFTKSAIRKFARDNKLPLLIFVYADLDGKDIGKEVLQFFGIEGDSLQVFGEDFVGDKLKPFIKSDPIPDINDRDIKIVVGNNFDEIVLDESKDVLLKIYAPWCSQCQALEPTYNKLAKHLSGIDALVMAKMDGTTNEHASVKAGGFPTFLFFPAGNKNINPKYVERDHTLVGLYKFLKKHAKIPFKLQRPTSSFKLEDIISTKPTSTSNGEDIVSSDTYS
ncbi:disulfide isomerase-like 1-4, partial [Thalictrum thalictroides]